jgi:hypothetical protein
LGNTFLALLNRDNVRQAGKKSLPEILEQQEGIEASLGFPTLCMKGIWGRRLETVVMIRP